MRPFIGDFSTKITLLLRYKLSLIKLRTIFSDVSSFEGQSVSESFFL